MQAGVLEIAALAGGGDGADAADVLHHGGQGQRHDGYRRGEQHTGIQSGPAEQSEQGIFKAEGQADPGGIQQGLDLCRIHHLHAGSLTDGSHTIGAHHTQQDRDNFYHTLAPDVAPHHNGNGDNGDGPVGAAVGNGGGGQGQADTDDDRSGDNRGKVAHHRLGAENLEQGGQHHV